ncbi:hypothetical protein GLYMA_04G104150v4 [Glycine max]|nr:hypothetical protein GLYMA_04G104150v4 [Glycine max]KAH1110791.1 hypothetical protein GYH30_009553 [Glycine max]
MLSHTHIMLNFLWTLLKLISKDDEFGIHLLKESLFYYRPNTNEDLMFIR